MVSGTISPRYSRYFSPFPHGTGSLSVSQEYLALADGAARFRRGFTGPALLRILSKSINFPIQDSHPLWCIFPDDFSFVARSLCQSYNPRKAVTSLVWASPASLATTTGITTCFLLLQVLRCFSSLRSPLDLRQDPWSSTRGVAPFGYQRINAYLLLPAAFRSLSRPSSPLRA